MAQSFEDDFGLDVSQEFIESGKESHPKKRGGPYTKDEKIKRLNEVHRLYFEYGYSARMISEMMNINRNTINGDIDYWRDKIVSSSDMADPEVTVIINIHRFDIQRSRLRESLDKAENFQQKLAIERMIFDIDCKIIHTQIKLAESVKRIHRLGIGYLNDWLEKKEIDIQYLTYMDTISVSKKAKERIAKIIKEDNKNRGI